MTTILVSNSKELLAALKHTTGGDTILLQNTGEKYSLNLQNYNSLTSPVTIASADNGHPAVFETVILNGSSNLHFDSVSFDSSAAIRSDYLRDINITNSSNIIVSNSTMMGTATAAYGQDGVVQADSAISIRDSNSVTFSNNTISNYDHGFYLNNNTDTTLSGNDISHLQGDAIQMVQVTDTLIQNNYIHDIIGTTYDLNHMDMIQLWSSGATKPTVNLTIKDNIFDAGDGVATQTIFMRNEAVDGAMGTTNPGYHNPAMYYQNIVIENNVIYNGHSHGIAIGEANGVTIRDNTLILNDEAQMLAPRGSQEYEASAPTIHVSTVSQNVTIEDNIGKIDFAPAGAVITNNLAVDYVNPNAANYINKLFANAEFGGDVTLAGLKVLPGSLADKMGVGSTLSDFNSHPEHLTAAYTVKPFEGHEKVLQFDASLTADKSGFVDSSKATFLWNFSDGTTQIGKVVNHTFADYARYEVTLTVIGNSGETSTFTSHPETQDPLLLDLNFNDGTFTDKSSYATGVTGVKENLVSGVEKQGYHLASNAALSLARGETQLYNNDQLSVTFDYKKSNTAGDDGTIFQVFNAMSLVLKPNGALELSINDSLNQTIKLTTSAVMTDDQWHQVSVSYDSVNHKTNIFVDGKMAGETEAGSYMSSESSWAAMFGHYSWGNSADGYIDNIKITSDATSLTDAANLYHALENTLHPTVAAPHVVLPIDLLKSMEMPIVDLNSYANKYIGGELVDTISKSPINGGFYDGKAGDDIIASGAGNDWVVGGDGNDTISTWKGNDVAFGGKGDDSIRGAELAFGGEGNDKLFAEDLSAKLYGEEGNDQLTGYGGDDLLVGGAGSDKLNAGGGNDILVADKDDNWLQGGVGVDTVLYGSEGLIDFSLGTKVYGVEKFDMTNGMANTFKLNYKDIVQSDDDVLYVFGDNGDKVDISGQKYISQAGQVEHDGQTFNVYHAHAGSWLDADLLVATNVQVVA